MYDSWKFHNSRNQEIMAYQFTHHAIQRCTDRGLEYDQARTLFESATPCKFKSSKRRFEKLTKYGADQFKTEYWYCDGFVFVAQRKDKSFSFVLTVIPCKRKDLIVYARTRRKNFN